MAKSRRSYKGAPVSNTLASGGLAQGATTISLATAMSGWPTSAAPFFVVVNPGTANEEKICVIYATTTTLTVVDEEVTSGWSASVNGRGVDDTTDRVHAGGATIYPVFTALEANQANLLVSTYANQGGIVYQGASDPTQLAVGTAGQVLKVNSGATAPEWGQVSNVGIASDAAIALSKLATGALPTGITVASANLVNGTVALEDLATAVANALVPVGTIAMYGGASAPTGWLLCDGSSFSSGTYPNLNTVLSGTTTPDLRGRVPVGVGTGTGLTARTLGATGGAETHVLATSEMPSHRHGGAVGSNGTHAHFYNQTTVTQRKVFNNDLDELDDVVSAFGTATTATDGAHIHSIEFEGGGGAHNNMQPFRVVNYIIKHD